MEEKDLIKLRCKINEDFKKWFSYSKKHHCLYSDCVLTECEYIDLASFLGKGFIVIVSPYSTYIIPIKSLL